VGRFPTGLRGVDEIFELLCEEAKAPAEDLGPELIARAKAHNYIPSSAEADFAEALFREYRKYWEQRHSGQKPSTERATWRGIPREQVPWFPMLHESLCDGCAKCLEFCAQGVYAKRDTGVVHVQLPLNCLGGCDACARLCRHAAITFPPRNMLSTLAGSG
jgi:Pyruvate/2-oxoacid:ferredoxin oxidoreductase delta subunit